MWRRRTVGHAGPGQIRVAACCLVQSVRKGWEVVPLLIPFGVLHSGIDVGKKSADRASPE